MPLRKRNRVPSPSPDTVNASPPKKQITTLLNQLTSVDTLDDTLDESLNAALDESYPVKALDNPVAALSGDLAAGDASTADVAASDISMDDFAANNSATADAAMASKADSSIPSDGVHESPDSVYALVVGQNPFSAHFPNTKTILPPALAISTVKRLDGTIDVNEIVPVNILEAYRPTVAQRLLSCASHADSTSIRTPKGGVINVALANPADLSVDRKSGYLWSQKHNSWVVSSLLGQTTYYSNTAEAIRQVCITPFTHGWYRFTALLGQVYGEPNLFFQTWKGGVTFGTSRFDSNGQIVLGKGGKGGGGVAPIEGSILKVGKEIPTFDGRTKFQLSKYWEHPYTGDVAKGSAVMLLFTVKKGGLPSGVITAAGMPPVKFGAYLNVLGIIVLAEPSEPFSDVPSQEDPKAFGVEFIRGLPEAEESESEAGDEPFL